VNSKGRRLQMRNLCPDGPIASLTLSSKVRPIDDMKLHWISSLFALAGLLPACTDARADASPPSPTISIGDSIDQVRQSLADLTTPIVPSSNATPGSQALMEPHRGLVVFFNAENKVYRLRLNPPYAIAVCGTKFGDQRQSILDRLGTPAKSQPNQAFPERTSYIYDCSTDLSVRLDFTTDNTVTSILILRGSIPVPPVSASPPDPVELLISQVAAMTAQPQATKDPERMATGLQAAGQLAPSHDIGCPSIQALKSQYTAADLYSATRKCLDQNQFDMAAPLFMVAGAYGRFDSARITDKTVSGGISILIMNTADRLTDEQKKGFQTAVMSLHDDPRKQAAFCTQIAKLGPPDYIPTYLTSHGLGVTDGRQSDQNGLAVDFDRNGIWAAMLSEGLLCTVTK
jgi:hypothetical protein